jgi:hypothetical protein
MLILEDAVVSMICKDLDSMFLGSAFEDMLGDDRVSSAKGYLMVTLDKPTLRGWRR